MMRKARTKTLQITRPFLTMSFEVDEDIAELVLLLNKKGFYTNSCCSGHAEEGYFSWYIGFNYLPSSKNDLLKKIASGVSDLQIESGYRLYMSYQKENERHHLHIEFDDEDMLNMEKWKKYLGTYLGTNDISLEGPKETLFFRSVINSDFYNRYGEVASEEEAEQCYRDYSLNKGHENQIIVSRLIRQLSEEVNKLPDEVGVEVEFIN